jgi:hypothetical protein
VGEEVPSAGAIAVVVEPGAEDEVRSSREEETIDALVCFVPTKPKNGRGGSYMMMNHVKKPQ